MHNTTSLEPDAFTHNSAKGSKKDSYTFQLKILRDTVLEYLDLSLAKALLPRLHP